MVQEKMGYIWGMYGGYEGTRETYLKSEIGRKYVWLCENSEPYLNPSELEGQPKINASFLHANMRTECYREVLVSYIPMIPILKKQVEFHEADYILYMHAYARADDLGEAVLEEIRYIANKRKQNAEIIVLGKAANVERDLKEGEIDNITFVHSNFCKYLGDRFDFNIKDEFFVYDDFNDHLAIWPVNGCQNNCRFCRRSYMYIPFESQTFSFIKGKLDWYKENFPEQMEHISLRAENLTEYGLDLYGKPMLHRIINLLDSYDEIKKIQIKIGMCIGEITDNMLDTICNSKKIIDIGLNLETASNRLLKLCGKNHTMERAREIYNKIRIANPKISIHSTVMIGIPTETVGEIIEFANFVSELGIDYIHCNFYMHSNRDGFKDVKQLSESCKYYHLELFYKYLLKGWYRYRYRLEHPSLVIRYRDFHSRKKATRKYIYDCQYRKEYNEVNRMDLPILDFVMHQINFFDIDNIEELRRLILLRQYAKLNQLMSIPDEKALEILNHK